jgi:mono/diheme cytochrome c family protein
MKLRIAAAALLSSVSLACTPPAPTDGATVAPAAAPAADIAAPAPESGPAAPNTTDTLSTAPAAATASPAAAPQVTAPATPATPPAPATAAPAASADATPAEIANGRSAYTRTCAMCHGPKGEGTPAGSPIATRDPAAIANKVTKGVINPGERMPAMGAMLSADEIDDVSKFIAAGLPQ